jgi:protein-disulfide isomerase
MTNDGTSDDRNANNARDSNTNSNTKTNNSNNNTISINRSTFTKLAVVGVAALMIASFFGGYTWHATVVPSGQSGPTLAAANGGLQLPQQPIAQVPGGMAPGQPGAAPQPTKVAAVNIDGAPTKGKADAPVTMVEFADFQCPFCGRFVTDSLQQIEKKYVDTGQVKFVYEQYPLPFHPNAQPAAMAAECANAQGKFWPMHDKLYATQTTWESQDSAAVKNTFKQYAAGLGLNAASFNSCLDSSKYSDKIQRESSLGSQYGVSGTPTFYIGNQKAGYTQIVGAQPITSFEQMIKQLSGKSA